MVCEGGVGWEVRVSGRVDGENEGIDIIGQGVNENGEKRDVEQYLTAGNFLHNELMYYSLVL